MQEFDVLFDYTLPGAPPMTSQSYKNLGDNMVDINIETAMKGMQNSGKKLKVKEIQAADPLDCTLPIE